jgi:PAS domain S-box-containing protein
MGKHRNFTILIEEDHLQCDLSLRLVSDQGSNSMDLQVISCQDLGKKLPPKTQPNLILINGIDRMNLTDTDISLLRQLSVSVPMVCIAWDGLSKIDPLLLNSEMEFYQVRPALAGDNYSSFMASILQHLSLNSSYQQKESAKPNLDEKLVLGINSNQEIFLINKQVYRLIQANNLVLDDHWTGAYPAEMLSTQDHTEGDQEELKKPIVGKEVPFKFSDGEKTLKIRFEKHLWLDNNHTDGVLMIGVQDTGIPTLENTILAFEQNSLGLFDSIQECVVVTDFNRRIIHTNSAFLKVFAYEKDEILGQSTRVLYESETEFLDVVSKIADPLLDRAVIEIVNFKRKDGTIFSGEIGIHPLMNAGNRVLGYVSLIRDISQRLDAEKEKQKIEDSLRKTLILARLSRWTYHFGSKEFTVSEEFHKNFATDARWLKISKEEFIQKWVHPDDRMIVENAFNVELTDNNPPETEFRLVKSDQSISFIYAEINSVVYGDDGGFGEYGRIYAGHHGAEDGGGAIPPT